MKPSKTTLFYKFQVCNHQCFMNKTCCNALSVIQNLLVFFKIVFWLSLSIKINWYLKRTNKIWNKQFKGNTCSIACPAMNYMYNDFSAFRNHYHKEVLKGLNGQRITHQIWFKKKDMIFCQLHHRIFKTNSKDFRFNI